MSKRFSDTEIWRKKWFCDLSPALKTFWRYICDTCDNSGVWEMNLPLAEFQIGCKLSLTDILSYFHGNIRQLSENKLLVVDFIQFQYGELKEECTPHRNIFNLLKKHNLSYPIDRVLDTLMDKDKDKDKEKKKEIVKRKQKTFDPPTIQEMVEYFIQNGYSKESAERAHKYYSAANWYDSKGNPVRNWKQKSISVWFKEENKDKTQNNSIEEKYPLFNGVV